MNDISAKFEKKMTGWKAKLLSQGGKLVLIKHVLQSIPSTIWLIKHVFPKHPLYNMAAFDPPRAVHERLEAICGNFQWGDGEKGNKYHWISWHKYCLPTQEGGIEIRSLQVINTAFGMKLWWHFKSSLSLWSNFMKCKYAFKCHPTDCP